MARKIIQPDLMGRDNHEYRTAREERLAGICCVTKWVTVFGFGFSMVLVATHIMSVINHRSAGWAWQLLTSLALGAAFAQSAVRLKWARWSWPGFAVSLAVHGYGMYRSYLAFADDYGVMTVVPEFEMVLLAALAVLHGLWSLMEKRSASA